MHRTERIFIVTALLVVGLGLIWAIGRGAAGLGNSPFSLIVYPMGLALVLVAAAGATWVRRVVEPQGNLVLPEIRLPFVKIPLDIIVPSLLAAGFVVFLQLFESGSLQGVIVLAAGCAFAGVLWAQVFGRDASSKYFAAAQSALNIISHLTAFLLFSVIYGLKVRAIVSASAVAVVTALLLFELLSRDASWHQAMKLPVEGRRTTLGLLALAGGAVAGQLTWGLNYWAALPTLIGGAFLLLVFYVIHGIAVHYVDHKLTRQVFVEFGTVGAIGMAVIFGSAFIQ